MNHIDRPGSAYGYDLGFATPPKDACTRVAAPPLNEAVISMPIDKNLYNLLKARKKVAFSPADSLEREIAKHKAKSDSRSRSDGPRYRVGDEVWFVIRRGSPRQPPKRYSIAKVLPLDQTGIYQYRLNAVGPGPERVAFELDLTADLKSSR